MDDLHDIRARFPAIDGHWARFDGPGGTQVVDAAIEAAADWQRNGNNANSCGAFAAAEACDDLVARASATMGRLLGADPKGITFGPSTTTNMMALTRAIGRRIGPGDEVICTALDHDSNVSPWLLLAEDTGCTVQIADFDPSTGRLAVDAVADLVSSSTRWVAVTGSSNVVGTIPDVAAITRVAHEVGARVVVDGVHLTPHRQVNLAYIGCDVFTTSSYKWYGPHAGIMWIEPGLLDDLCVYKLRAVPDRGPERFQYGTTSWESLAGLDAAAGFLLDVGVDRIAEAEAIRFRRLLDGLHDQSGIRVVGPQDSSDRAPTLMFEVEGLSPGEVASTLADRRVAVWDGNNYAVDAMVPLGLDAEDGAVRAGISVYTNDEDVDRLLTAVADLAN